MPRRSRRSPRHLRVSGQRRRRYRDERYPTQSAMPLDAAAASPEMASGKVWIRYPVAQANEEQIVQDAPQSTPDYSREETAPAVALPVATEEAPASQAEPVQIAEPQADAPVTVVNTDDTQAIEAPVHHEPSVIPAAAEAGAEAIAQQAQPADAVEAPEVSVPEVNVPVVAESAPEETADEHAGTEVSAATEAQVEEVLHAPVAAEEAITPVSEPLAPVAARDIPVEALKANAETRWKHFASAPMTKAPAPVWQPEPARQSDWQRPAFKFEGRGSAGGHSATHQATAPATKP